MQFLCKTELLPIIIIRKSHTVFNTGNNRAFLGFDTLEALFLYVPSVTDYVCKINI